MDALCEHIEPSLIYTLINMPNSEGITRKISGIGMF